MNDALAARIKQIMEMTRSELRELWRDTFHEVPRSGNVQWMRKRLAWGIQAQVLGGLSEAAKQRIEELTPLALASMPWGFSSFPHDTAPVASSERSRVTSGTTLTRRYKGRTLEVLVRDDGFEYEGQVYRSLTAVATAITGSHWNGNLFFFGRSDKRRSA